ncbi:MAG: aa3-type cytochrome c oxidase subunit IV [Alphaproteobacteria bacterium]|nr:aa3-type cytochrome c oxidase subunit IV [Alphaproteobacteria bacterium]
MATTPHGSSNVSTSANFDMRQAEEMWANFNRLAKWGGILVLILLIGMAMFLTGSHPPQP